MWENNNKDLGIKRGGKKLIPNKNFETKVEKQKAKQKEKGEIKGKKDENMREQTRTDHGPNTVSSKGETGRDSGGSPRSGTEGPDFPHAGQPAPSWVDPGSPPEPQCQDTPEHRGQREPLSENRQQLPHRGSRPEHCRTCQEPRWGAPGGRSP